jgi:hypothetical protein
MMSLEQRRRGIVLLHDIHPSTATAVPSLLAQLKAKGCKVVHLKPKAPVETLAAFQAPPKEHRNAVDHRRLVNAKQPSPLGWIWQGLLGL